MQTKHDVGRNDVAKSGRLHAGAVIIIGLFLLVAPLVVATINPIVFGNTQAYLRIFAALGGGMIGSLIPGSIRVRMPGLDVLGGIAVFYVLLTYEPLWQVANQIAESRSEPARREHQSARMDDSTPALREATLEQCIAAKRQAYERLQIKETVGGARVGGSGLSGAQRSATERVCVSVGPGQQLIEAASQPVVCHGGRCRVSAPTIAGDSACIVTVAMSELRPFGGGGSAQYRLTAKYRDIAATKEVEQFKSECKASGV